MTAAALVLASASAARAELLARAGLAVARDPAELDEAALKSASRARGDNAVAGALRLAEAKALAVAPRHPGMLVIGADQILSCDGAWFDKPRDLGEARAQLRRLRGRTHDLATAAVLAKDGEVLWRGSGCPRLAMRGFSDAFLEDYLAREGEAALGSVGAYRLEAAGIQLFDRVEGDFFTILGLPLLPLLAALRRHGALAS